jgi:hypothetical protein
MEVGWSWDIAGYIGYSVVGFGEVWLKTGVVTKICEEGSGSCRVGLSVVIAQLRNWQQVLAVVLLVIAVCTQGLFKGGVCSFSLAINFWVEGGTQISGGSQGRHNLFPEKGCE